MRKLIDWSVDRFCIYCQRKMRRGGTRATDYPNTVVHFGNGICGTCANRPEDKRSLPIVLGAQNKAPIIDGKKRCHWCSQWKPLGDMCKASTSRGKEPSTLCKFCEALYQHKLPYVDYIDMLAKQNNSCAICNNEFSDARKTKPHIDHDHNCCSGNRSCGKCIRGLLCGYCNSLLGLAKDNPVIMQNAIAFLKHNRTTEDGCDVIEY